MNTFTHRVIDVTSGTISAVANNADHADHLACWYDSIECRNMVIDEITRQHNTGIPQDKLCYMNVFDTEHAIYSKLI